MYLVMEVVRALGESVRVVSCHSITIIWLGGRLSILQLAVVNTGVPLQIKLARLTANDAAHIRRVATRGQMKSRTN